MEKQTLEEAAEEFYSEQSKAYEDEIEPIFDTSRYLVAGFIEGAKWQQEKSYSEEEVKFQANKLLNDLLYKQGFNTNVIGGIVNEWFEQFKKK